LLPILFFALLVSGATTTLRALMALSLAVGPPSPAPVGAAISVRPQVFGAALDDLWYRFRVREIGGDFRIISDTQRAVHRIIVIVIILAGIIGVKQ
jgi:hypothetical protein